MYSEEKMMRCPKCGAELELGSSFCDQCGASIDEKDVFENSEACEVGDSGIGILKCPSCGSMNEEGSVFCSECGHMFESVLDRCSECGAILNEDDDFCSVCGTPNSNKKTIEYAAEGKTTKTKPDTVMSSSRTVVSSSVSTESHNEITERELAAAKRNFHKPPVL